MNECALFDESFAALTGNIPLSWQRRLFLQYFLRGDIPPALDIPTGLGKTSVIAIWLAARALADEDARKALPRRLVYVVDRRGSVGTDARFGRGIRGWLRRDGPPEESVPAGHFCRQDPRI
jgi:CRISPR-associated endonuclease/helicase Cas3